MSDEIDAIVDQLPSWQAATVSRVRQLIKRALPDVVEDVKWKKPGTPAGVPVWSHDGIICTGETYKDKVKLTFHKGALIGDPTGLFNSGFGGNTRRAIDLFEGDSIDADAFMALVEAAAAHNAAKASASHE